MAAERETVDRLIAHHLADQIGARFQARISGVTRSGLFVRLAETGADGFVPAATLAANITPMTKRRTRSPRAPASATDSPMSSRCG